MVCILLGEGKGSLEKVDERMEEEGKAVFERAETLSRVSKDPVKGLGRVSVGDMVGVAEGVGRVWEGNCIIWDMDTDMD